MGRPLKKGLDYFNVDCTEDDKIRFLRARHKSAGYGIWTSLLKKIYSVEGYFCLWSEKHRILFAQEINEDPELVKSVVETCVSEGLFHEETLVSSGILTSRGIQKQYLRIVTEAKRKGCEIDSRYTLLEITPEETPVNYGVNRGLLPKSQEESTQSKVKESKVNNNLPIGRSEPEAPVGDPPETPGEPLPDPDKTLKAEYRAIAVQDKRTLFTFITTRHPQFIEPYVALWNIFAQERGLAQVKTISEARRRKFRIRIKEPPFVFTDILSKAKDSEFILSGKWFGFDWILENDTNYVKVLEGSYDKPSKSQSDESDREEYLRRRAELEAKTKTGA